MSYETCVFCDEKIVDCDWAYILNKKAICPECGRKFCHTLVSYGDHQYNLKLIKSINDKVFMPHPYFVVL